MQKPLLIGITLGDLNGIGPEVVLKSLEDKRMLELCTPVIFASIKSLNFYNKVLNFSQNFHKIQHAQKALTGKINVVNCWQDEPQIQFGTIDKSIGSFAASALKAAVTALKNDEIQALVTGPIHKDAIYSEAFPFTGHTPFLADALSGDSLMLMASDELKVGLVTEHIPVGELPEHLSKELIINKAQILEESLKKDFGIHRPKIAVLSVNPHVGDNGLIGTEDQDILMPAIEQLKKSGMLAFGPYAADSFFGAKQEQFFDAVLAMYHDQGLIPFKSNIFGMGVNFTAGLSHIRTSPDHGTGFDIAGQGTADPGSFLASLFMAIDLVRHRRAYEASTHKPLKTSLKAEKR
ncbi:MAG: 4-hydroxythreonine-4-phosphate dehydrogenase PdxA [Flavobacteriaceae bacterium]|nr:4-hydroxythreonine-4-phosphate dehydrogenase PdxA [Flavobacteriaceae bacterium]